MQLLELAANLKRNHAYYVDQQIEKDGDPEQKLAAKKECFGKKFDFLPFHLMEEEEKEKEEEPEDDKEADDSEQAMQEAAVAYEGLGKMDYRAALVKFYEEHNPEKLADVDKVMAKWEGREHLMLVALQEKYNRELVVAPPEIEL